MPEEPLLAGMTARMGAGTRSAIGAGIAAFVRAEFFSSLSETFTLRMGAFLLSHDCLLARVTFA